MKQIYKIPYKKLSKILAILFFPFKILKKILIIIIKILAVIVALPCLIIYKIFDFFIGRYIAEFYKQFVVWWIIFEAVITGKISRLNELVAREKIVTNQINEIKKNSVLGAISRLKELVKSGGYDENRVHTKNRLKRIKK